VSAVGDALKALRDVVLMQERLDVMRSEQKRIAEDVSGLNAYVLAVDKRVVRIETMIEMTERQSTQKPRIEG
jgi:hypothetical protein